MRRILLTLLVAVLVASGWLLWRAGDDRTQESALDADASRVERDAPDATLRGSPGGPPAPATPQEDRVAETPSPTSRDVVKATGRAVDQRHRPVPGAHVVASLDGTETGRAESDADGVFSVVLGERTGETRFGALRVRAGGRGADRLVYLGPDSSRQLAYGRIVLVEMRSLDVRVVRGGAPVADAVVALRGVEGANPRAVLATASSDEAGRVRFDGLVASKVAVFAVAAGTGRGYEEVELPRSEVVDLELPDDRSATVHVRRAPSNEPVAGAEVHLSGLGTQPFPHGTDCLPPLPPIHTDDTGRAVVSGLPPGYVWVVARAPGLAMRNAGMRVERVTLEPDEDEATVTLHAYRAVRFPIQDPATAPADGTVLEVRRYQPLVGYDVGSPGARVEDGHVVLEPFPPGHDWGHVVSKDGRWAMWTAPMDADLGKPIGFGPIHDLRVRLTWHDGSPAVGEHLWASLSPRGRGAMVRTDANGEALFPRCLAESAAVMWTSVEGGFGTPIARVPLTSDPGTVAVTIGRPLAIAVTLHSGGVPTLPLDYTVHVHVPDLGGTGGRGPRRVPSREVQEDAERGEVRFRWLAMPGGEAPPVTIRPEGMPAVTATPVEGADGVWRASVELQASTTLRVRVEEPESGRCYLLVERWNEEYDGFYATHDDPAYRDGRRAEDGVHTFRGFAPGRYRLRDHHSGITSDPFDLTQGGGVLDLVLDLRSSVLVQGRVALPDGEQAAFASVRIEGRRNGSVSTMNPVRVKADGSFEFRSQLGARHRLVVDHPLLAQAGGPPEVVVSANPIVLTLVSAPQVVFQVEGLDFTTPELDPRVMSMGPAGSGPLRVRLALGGAWQEANSSVTPIAKDGLFRVGVPSPGSWSLSIRQHGFVPHLVEDLEVGSGTVDLGTLVLSEGATLAVRLLKGAGPLPTHLSVTATRTGDVPYTASAYQVQPGDPPTLRVSGLGPGTFRVVVKPLVVKGEPLLEQDVQSDGSTPITLDLRL